MCVYIIHRFRCNKTKKPDHMGKPEVVKHIQTQGHKGRAQYFIGLTSLLNEKMGYCHSACSVIRNIAL